MLLPVPAVPYLIKKVLYLYILFNVERAFLSLQYTY